VSGGGGLKSAQRGKAIFDRSTRISTGALSYFELRRKKVKGALYRGNTLCTPILGEDSIWE